MRLWHTHIALGRSPSCPSPSPSNTNTPQQRTTTQLTLDKSSEASAPGRAPSSSGLQGTEGNFAGAVESEDERAASISLSPKFPMRRAEERRSRPQAAGRKFSPLFLFFFLLAFDFAFVLFCCCLPTARPDMFGNARFGSIGSWGNGKCPSSPLYLSCVSQDLGCTFGTGTFSLPFFVCQGLPGIFLRGRRARFRRAFRRTMEGEI